MKAVVLLSCLWVCWFTVEAQFISRVQLSGTWIGVHTEYDTDDFCPLPTYLQLEADGRYTLGMVDGSGTPVRSTWAVSGDSVRLDTIHFAPGLVKIQDDLLRIGVNHPMMFRKFTDIPIDSISAQKQLIGRVWHSDSLAISLFANGRVSLENRNTKKRTTHFWRLARVEQSSFLVIQGNAYQRASGYKSLLQVSSISSKQMEFVGWNGKAVATQEFRLVGKLAPGDSCRPSGFQPCSNCFTPSFFKTNPGRTAQRYALLQRIKEQVTPIDLPGQSGLVQVQFVVNCQGESGWYDVKGLDTNYHSKQFSSAITDRLLAFCRNNIATDVSLRQSEQPGDPEPDMALVVTFRLVDGRVTDLLP